ncbi:MAG: hypothetical protein D6702_08715 [Planctomycetota bacterium]|nr:MAG: hypothetical protein D6702_08715 [Planctomycetota bacterium]
MRGALLLPPLLAAACGPAAEPAPPPPESLPADWLGPRVEAALAATAADALPEEPAFDRRELIDLLEAANAGGRLAARAERRLAEAPVPALVADLLSVVEDRLSSPAERILAYDRLDRIDLPAMIPRLVLRLKYEKDWFANTFLAAALLRQGNGAGLEALRTILADEEADERARAAAAAVLRGLPGADPDGDFAADWEHLLRLHRSWQLERRLGPDGPEAPDDRGLRAEVWRMIARLRSQPLRPVDDARFVLSRMRCGAVVPALLEAARDESLYVREGALQTLSWIGYPVGHWAERSGADLLSFFRTALRDRRARLRVLEALGATGSAQAAELALPWLLAGTRDERTAAADALLRCAGPGLGERLPRPEPGPAWSPEARWSLALLRAELDPTAPPPTPPPGLASGEQERRRRWAAARARRPGAG